MDGLGLRAKIRLTHRDALSGKLCCAEAQTEIRLGPERHCKAIDAHDSLDDIIVGLRCARASLFLPFSLIENISGASSGKFDRV